MSIPRAARSATPGATLPQTRSISRRSRSGGSRYFCAQPVGMLPRQPLDVRRGHTVFDGGGDRGKELIAARAGSAGAASSRSTRSETTPVGSTSNGDLVCTPTASWRTERPGRAIRRRYRSARHPQRRWGTAGGQPRTCLGQKIRRAGDPKRLHQSPVLLSAPMAAIPGTERLRFRVAQSARSSTNQLCPEPGEVSTRQLGSRPSISRPALPDSRRNRQRTPNTHAGVVLARAALMRGGARLDGAAFDVAVEPGLRRRSAQAAMPPTSSQLEPAADRSCRR